MKRQRWVRLTSLAAVVSIGVFLLFDHVKLYTHLFNRFGKQNERTTPHVENTASKLCRNHKQILYGIFTMPKKAQTRAVVRQQTQCDINNEIHSTVFVMGTPRTESDHEIVARESKLHGDVFILTCDENMNEGKSYTYFKEALERFPCFHFYAKVDDDTAFSPNKLSARIMAEPNEGPLFFGKYSVILDTLFVRYIVKTIRNSFRDMSWSYEMQNYTAGMLYILNTQAIQEWVALNPTQLYGDEDYRTTYYMETINAKVINLDTAFHDYIKFQTYGNHWKLEITNNSLAVHQCKSLVDLSDAFASICSRLS